MCGIAGIIYSKEMFDHNEIVMMTDTIIHRGPDDYGHFYDKCVALGHRRLSILDLSKNGKQPMFYKSLAITYNGEIYNYLELRDELQKQGYEFHTGTDTEVILAAYACWGEECLERFNGMWSFAIYDSEKQNVFCSRDRFGVKPFYYAEIGGKFCFASEIKEFTVLEGWKAIANRNRLYDYIAFGGIHDHLSETLFEKVFQLRPGEKILYDIKSGRYTAVNWYCFKDRIKKNQKTSYNDAKISLKKYFYDSIKLRLRSDVKVGSCLSGGLDSSAIVCVMNEVLVEQKKEDIQQTFSACYNGYKVDEQQYIDEVVTKTKTLSNKIFPSYKDLMQTLDDVIWHQDEPFGSASIFAQWEVYRLARQNEITVLLDGQGSDEYMAGYTSFHKVYFRELFVKGRWSLLKKSLQNYKKLYNDYYYSPYRDLVETGLRAIFSDRLFETAKKTARKLRTHNTTGRYTGLMDYNDGKYQHLQRFNKTIFDETESELFYTSMPKLLHHQDRNSMAHSIESRAPFLDYRLVEFVASLPGDYKINQAVTKYIFRDSMTDVIPDKIKYRYDKLGFATPIDEWVCENAAEFRMEIEQYSKFLPDYVNSKLLLSRFDKAVQEGKMMSGEFFRVVCAGRWMKIFQIEPTQGGLA
jgi:asparagine synthase (glutamine-hydrolysing)